MNDLMRPALYGAWHDVLPVYQGSVTGPYGGTVTRSGTVVVTSPY